MNDQENWEINDGVHTMIPEAQRAMRRDGKNSLEQDRRLPEEQDFPANSQEPHEHLTATYWG